MKKTLCLIIALVCCIHQTQAKDVDFHTEVAPILMQHCYECHGGAQAKGGFSMNTLALWLDKKAAKPGDGKGSLAIELLREKDPEFAMPPKGKPRLTEQEIVTLTNWIDQGMKWDEGFTFARNTYEPPLKPRRPELPEAVDGRVNPIDRIIDAYMAQHSIEPQPLLGDAAFYRRVSLDLIGLPPNADDVDAFVANEDPAKRDKLVDALLNDNVGYARHWLTFWNDLLRNDYKGTGYIDGGRKQITTWLYKALLENMPYDQFTRELLAPPTGLSEGFIKGIQWRGDVNASQTTEVQFAQNVGQVFLGINLKCASCHDSFIDRWTLEEAYGLAAIYSKKPMELYRCDKPTGQTAKPKWLFPELGEVDATAPQNERLKQLADLMTSPDNGRLTRTIANRIWHRMMGRGIVHPVDAMQTEPWSADLLDYLAVHLSDNQHDLKSVMRLIATSRAYQSKALTIKVEPESEGYRFAGPLVKRMTAEQFIDAIRQVTENPASKAAFPAHLFEKVTEVSANEPGARAGMFNADLLQRALGRPNREQVVTSRPEQLTTLQALDLVNGEALGQLISAGTDKLVKAHGKSGRDFLIELVYRRALSREPSDKEMAICREIMTDKPGAETMDDLLWSVFMLPEFQHIR